MRRDPVALRAELLPNSASRKLPHAQMPVELDQRGDGGPSRHGRSVKKSGAETALLEFEEHPADAAESALEESAIGFGRIERSAR